jgi:hypothetical protein
MKTFGHHARDLADEQWIVNHLGDVGYRSLIRDYQAAPPLSNGGDRRRRRADDVDDDHRDV